MVTAAVLAACDARPARAGLIDNGSGLIYDTELNITWYNRPNYDTHVYGDYALWAQSLNVGGVTGWRLPTTPGTTTGITSEGEMGHLFYVTLGNPIGVNGVGEPVGEFLNKGPFTDLRMGFYTSATDVNGYHYYFSFDDGKQSAVNISYWYFWIHGLAVHDGNVAVPEPSAVGVMGACGLTLMRRRR
jgi:hypothetical protein